MSSDPIRLDNRQYAGHAGYNIVCTVCSSVIASSVVVAAVAAVVMQHQSCKENQEDSQHSLANPTARNPSFCCSLLRFECTASMKYIYMHACLGAGDVLK